MLNNGEPRSLHSRGSEFECTSRNDVDAHLVSDDVCRPIADPSLFSRRERTVPTVSSRVRSVENVANRVIVLAIIFSRAAPKPIRVLIAIGSFNVRTSLFITRTIARPSMISISRHRRRKTSDVLVEQRTRTRTGRCHARTSSMNTITTMRHTVVC
jgi:hypothetical protein